MHDNVLHTVYMSAMTNDCNPTQNDSSRTVLRWPPESKAGPNGQELCAAGHPRGYAIKAGAAVSSSQEEQATAWHIGWTAVEGGPCLLPLGSHGRDLLGPRVQCSQSVTLMCCSSGCSAQNLSVPPHEGPVGFRASAELKPRPRIELVELDGWRECG